MKYALIGQRLGHSWSQRHFEQMFRSEGLESHSYQLHEMPSLNGLRRWVEDEEIAGFNVTIPYKQAVIAHLDEITPEAAAIGAVNCVHVVRKRLIGYNTDAPAFHNTLAPLLTDRLRHGTALVLGTGGAARAVSHALTTYGIRHLLVSRNPDEGQLSYDEAQILMHQQTESLLVNATPVGMHPTTDQSPWPASAMPGHGSLAYDLIYNPSPTLFLRQAAASGACTKDGLEMLQQQADLSWQIWQKTAQHDTSACRPSTSPRTTAEKDII